MSHEVLGDRFFQDRAVPAWHSIMKEGIDPTRQYTAAEAYDLIGKIDVRKVPLVTLGKNQAGEQIRSPYYGILRAPIPEDPEPRWFGSVSEEYVVVTPDEIVDSWDEHVRRHVQTMAFLRDGKAFVISSKLPSFSVRGEDVNNYGVIVNWMDGANASLAMTTSVCPVCMNTVKWGMSVATERYRFVHDQYIRHRMGQWFEKVIAGAERELPKLAEAMGVMAGYRLTQPSEEVKYVLSAAYPYPKLPKYDPLAPPEYNDKRQAEYEAEMKTADSRRVTAFDLFRGDGTGMRTLARRGTAWGLYQATVEVEDYRKGSSGDGLAASVLFGDRAATKERAFVAALQVATQEAVLA